ncbi:MAG: hypothetical protein ACM30E_11030, partial [Nitrososphaerales archaeon]
MSRKLLPPINPVVVAGVLLCAALVVVLFVAFSGSLSATTLSLMQAATPAPAATPSPGLASVAAGLAVTNTLSANPADDLTSATVNLHAGYIMDPYLLPVVGKAERAASDVVKGCNGFVSAQPNVVLNWTGKTDQLNVFVYSDGDAVLAIQMPDGSFICNDDAGARTVDPLLTIKSPAPGAYKVHVGAAHKDRPALGFLALTQVPLDDAKLASLDLSPILRRGERPKVQALQQLDPKALLLARAAIFGSAELQSGFKPVKVFAAGGGDIGAIRLEDGKLVCAGYVTAVPSYSFTWTGAAQPIRLLFEGQKDSSLAVVMPDEKVMCGMNFAAGNLNPAVDIAAPTPGQYRV